jgi:hypothetical protein
LPVGDGRQAGQALTLNREQSADDLQALLQASRRNTLPGNLFHDL